MLMVDLTVTIDGEIISYHFIAQPSDPYVEYGGTTDTFGFYWTPSEANNISISFGHVGFLGK